MSELTGNSYLDSRRRPPAAFRDFQQYNLQFTKPKNDLRLCQSCPLITACYLFLIYKALLFLPTGLISTLKEFLSLFVPLDTLLEELRNIRSHTLTLSNHSSHSWPLSFPENVNH